MRRSTSRPVLSATISALAALAASAIVLATGARTPSGRPVFPLDDSYIHLQYGWQAAHGQFLQYNPGDQPTSGATSLLYMLVLAMGFVAGIGHDVMPVAVIAASILLFALTTVLVADMTRRMAAAASF